MIDTTPSADLAPIISPDTASASQNTKKSDNTKAIDPADPAVVHKIVEKLLETDDKAFIGVSENVRFYLTTAAAIAAFGIAQRTELTTNDAIKAYSFIPLLLVLFAGLAAWAKFSRAKAVRKVELKMAKAEHNAATNIAIGEYLAMLGSTKWQLFRASAAEILVAIIIALFYLLLTLMFG